MQPVLTSSKPQQKSFRRFHSTEQIQRNTTTARRALDQPLEYSIRYSSNTAQGSRVTIGSTGFTVRLTLPPLPAPLLSALCRRRAIKTHAALPRVAAEGVELDSGLGCAEDQCAGVRGQLLRVGGGEEAEYTCGLG